MKLSIPVIVIGAELAQAAWGQEAPEGTLAMSLGLAGQLGDLEEVIPHDAIVAALRQVPPSKWTATKWPGELVARTDTGRHVAFLELPEGTLAALPMELRLGRSIGVDFRAFNLGVTALTGQAGAA